jgi:thiol:disulfide interchange protein DsbA
MKFKRLFFIILMALFAQAVFATEVNVKETPSKKPPAVEVIFETTMGSFTIELNPEKAPKTVANFLTYVDSGFYNNTLFHRVVPSFQGGGLVQGGGFEMGMKEKPTYAPIENESGNGLKNRRGTISMARRPKDPDSATAQFFINVVHHPKWDFRGNQLGYTVFGKVIDGMDVIDKMVTAPTKSLDRYEHVPKKDIVILSAKREQFISGVHYVVLDKPVPIRDSSKVEVVEAFSYGCPHCFGFESLMAQWRKEQASDVDFWIFPAVWNELMKLYARAFYAIQELNVAEKMHFPLFTAIVIEQKTLSNESELADFFATYGVDKKAFVKAFNSVSVENQVKQAEARVRSYHLASVPEIVVNGKYRIDPMRAGGRAQMLAVVDFLVNKERAMLKK